MTAWLLAATLAAASPDRFSEWLNAEFRVADGFDFPVGDANGDRGYVDKKTGRTQRGWVVTKAYAARDARELHPGEDWDGAGPPRSDVGQPVHVIAHGRVAFAGPAGGRMGHVVIVDHLYYENHERLAIRSVYAHLAESIVKVGDVVRRREMIGTVGQPPEGESPHLHLELRRGRDLEAGYWPSSHGRDAAWLQQHYADPRSFITNRRRLPVPQDEPALVLVDARARKMRVRLHGEDVGTFEVGFGQADGRKRRQGDLKTPRGMYFVTEKSKGPFPGRWGGFFGGHWIKINYPNPYDAQWGREEDLVTAREAARIRARWSARKLSPQGTALGGGIGFHGWIEDWDLDGPRRLSWGCVVMRNADIARVYPRIPIGAMVVLFD